LNRSVVAETARLSHFSFANVPQNVGTVGSSHIKQAMTGEQPEE
jgi:hypothetical protein